MKKQDRLENAFIRLVSLVPEIMNALESEHSGSTKERKEVFEKIQDFFDPKDLGGYGDMIDKYLPK